ncbi:isoprenoid synthase domain-containing protein [Protomyces lactucae-debilis]|uniref:Isoprenoid synthase domain-containing protein n=1 Tax=Protomyces lactucae-debilis TaxID=2754530 RepID=A0A1Y2FC04_PROLT|nr:isoprenoid synthase domain-containing protein [Protomyces lactucae-debilis]ORY80954.1 isoprenoid synthase domain-containing protein [Protomyces lactucae-debilis]
MSAAAGVRSIDAARSYCRQILQTFDHPSYLLAAFQPARSRDAFLALRALNVDLALVPDQVTQVAVGKMRYQFWTETVDRCFKGDPPAQPVAVLLDHVLQSGIQLTKPYLLRIIAERERRIETMQFHNLSALESYAERTYSTLLYLDLESLDIRKPEVDEIAQHIGLSMGIASTLRGIPYYAAKKMVPLPTDICAIHDVKQQDILRLQGKTGASLSGLQDAVFDVATRANDHLISASTKLAALRLKWKELGRLAMLAEVEAVALNAVPSQMFLQRLEKVNFDPTRPSLLKREWTMPYRLWRGFK